MGYKGQRPWLVENKPWVVSADALHYLRQSLEKITHCSPGFPGMPLLLRRADSAEVLVSGLQK